MTVVSPGTLSNSSSSAVSVTNCVGTSKPLPASGVIYVQNVPSSSSDPNYTAACRTSTQLEGTATVNHPLGYPQRWDPTTYGCKNGDVFLKGTLKGRLTIAADNNIDVIGNVTYSTGTGGNDLLGLIANNYVEIYHPIDDDGSAASSTDRDGNSVNGYYNLDLPGSTHGVPQPARSRPRSCRSPTRSACRTTSTARTTWAAITINGAIAQKYRGIVGTINTSGIREELQLRHAAEVPVAASLPDADRGRVADRHLGRAEGGLRVQRHHDLLRNRPGSG